mmetsp:Transcript_49688/g.97183  ORF Transcript_49688/g.97183 Transcript_49688/m.97183 type:complete len:110 (+) Transcript_49688:3328-3657(+)
MASVTLEVEAEEEGVPLLDGDRRDLIGGGGMIGALSEAAASEVEPSMAGPVASAPLNFFALKSNGLRKGSRFGVDVLVTSLTGFDIGRGFRAEFIPGLGPTLFDRGKGF